MKTSQIAFLSVFAAFIVVGRIMFQFLPNIQPVTVMLICLAIFAGTRSAVLLAIISTYVSNIYLGLGIWTIWQILGWVLVCLVSGLLSKLLREANIYVFALFCGIMAYIYGLVIQIGTFSYTGNFIAYYLASLPFDTMHAIGNIGFAIVLGPILKRILPRYLQTIQ